MTKQIFQVRIVNQEGFILSDGTLNLNHLLPKAYDILVAYDLNSELRKEIEELFDFAEPTFTNMYYSKFDEYPSEVEEDASYLWNESIFNYFNSIAPDGYYFGNTEGDGACIGWWKYAEEIELAEECELRELQSVEEKDE